MILTLVGIQSALLATMAACQRRAKVLRTLAVQRTDSFGARALARALSAHTRSATKLEHLVAARATAMIREFVQTRAFDQLMLSTITYVKQRVQKGGRP